MSKIGKKLIIIPQGVQVAVRDGLVMVKGPKGELQEVLHPKVLIQISGNEISVAVKNPLDRRQKALWGTFRALVSNMIKGVTEGYAKQLEIIGVGYKASVSGDKLVLNVGYSHPIELPVPKGLETKVEKNLVSVSGTDKQLVGQYASNIRAIRPPEPYKGKGIKYVGEVIKRKAGKVMKAVGT